MPAAMKNMIADTYQQLLERRNIDKITVKDLVDACGISRQTFYYHFKDILDVIDWMVERKMNQVLEMTLKQSTREDAIRYFVETAVTSNALIAKGLQSSKREHIESVFMRTLTAYLRALFHKANPHARISIEEEDILLKFCSGGMAHLLLSCREDSNTDIDWLTSQICSLLSGVSDTLYQ